MGANTIVGLRFEMATGQGSSELIGYGCYCEIMKTRVICASFFI